MNLWRQVRYGVRNLLQGSRRRSELTDELEGYYEAAAEEWRQRGLSDQEARRRARLEAGSMVTARDDAHAYGWENAIRAVGADLRFAARQLRKHPLFTATATVTLALGIGANTAIFTVVQSVLLAPLPYPDPSHLLVLQTRWSDSGRISPRVTGPDGADVRSMSRNLEAVSLYRGGTLGVQLHDHAAYTDVTWVDSNFASVFQVQPVTGRWFTDSEAHRAAMVNEAFAREHFGSISAALGQTLRVENESLEITGVLPESFSFPGNTQVWEASPLQPESHARTAFNYRAVARLRSGMSLREAQAELDSISHRLQTSYPEENRSKILSIQRLRDALTGNARPTLLFLWGTVALILLIACVNVTHLQLVRAMERQRELAIRRALGSSQWQVIRPVLLEGVLVSLLGGAAGVLIAFPAVRVLVAMAPKTLPRATEIHLNGWVVGFTLALSATAAVFSSIFPAIRAAKVDPAETLKHDSSRGMIHRGTSMLRNGLVVAEIAATFVLAMGAGLLLHTMMVLMGRDMGFQTSRMLVADADIPAHSLEDARRATQQFDQIFGRLSSVPGVEQASGIMGLPTSEYGSNGYYEVNDGVPASSQKPYSLFSVASPGYFQTMGIPLKRGRDFSAQDTYESPFVAIVSESLARQSFGDSDPIGKQIRCGLDTDKWMTIIGVVADVRQDSPAQKPGPNLYMAMAQHPYFANQIHLVLRTKLEPLNVMRTVQQQILSVNPLIALRFTTMDAMLNKSIATERFRAVLISAFAGVGLLLAMLGVYGTMAYAVAQRTFEIGIRMAFGAERSTILTSILRSSATLAAFGIAIGIAMSAFLSRLMVALLEGVHPMDPISLVSAAGILVLTAIVAAFAPGWRATRIDPMLALRAE